MEEHDKNNSNIELETTRWNFWFLASFSLLLIVTFVYYLPLRFRYQTITSDHGEEMDAHMENTTMDDHSAGHGRYEVHEEDKITEGIAVNLLVDPFPPMARQPAKLDFLVNEKPGDVPVPVFDLEIEHEKFMHVIGVRADMNEFFHIHPDPLMFETETEIEDEVANRNVLSVLHTFAKPGQYKIWSEIKKDGVIHAFGHPEFTVYGPGIKEDKRVSFARNVAVGDYQVLLKLNEPVVKEKETMLRIDIHTQTQDEAMLEDYLGAPMHLAIIKDDQTQFVHTHPLSADHMTNSFVPSAQAHGGEEESGEPEFDMRGGDVHTDDTTDFAVIFPEAGLYKAFAQFRTQGIDLPPDEALTAEFWIEVKEEAPFPISPWWALLIVSLILIFLLSKYVKKYIGEEHV